MNNNINVSLDKTTPVKCKCGGIVFDYGMILRKVSKILTGSSQDGLLPVEVMVCRSCGEILPETLPKNLPND